MGSHPLAKYISSFDSKFNTLFMDAPWREVFSRTDPPPQVRNPEGHWVRTPGWWLDSLDVAARVTQYLAGACVSHQFPISEAMLTYKQKSPDEDSCQKFVPFIGVVKVGIVEHNLSTSVDSDDAMVGGLSMLASPPPQTGGVAYGKDVTCTPPPPPPFHQHCLELVLRAQVGR
ncbi:hypothetical protein AAFF_G00233860 [Aldrovandia affinis]|uniref:Phosphofurin acidic cluster sorting protein 1/2 C-terminal domain-containing protein n=1 Tax=Aldrovandia affinis TaxID=143900 RepID=A0AAD7W4R9_9TELE|nr:hypothetical protein AAFF_G00233860 [Aldrovandia affinis]